MLSYNITVNLNIIKNLNEVFIKYVFLFHSHPGDIKNINFCKIYLFINVLLEQEKNKRKGKKK